MEFITVENFNYSKALVIDNAYDIYKLNRYIEFCRENDIKALCSQDLDLNYLRHFSDIRQLSIPAEAYNVSYINELKDLKELRLFSNSLKYINQEVLKNLTSLEIIYDEKINIDFSQLNFLRNLVINNFTNEDIEISNKLDCLHLKSCKKIKSLSFLSQCSIKKLKLYDLNRLLDISKVEELGNLSSLEIIDCTNIKNLEDAISKLKNLKELKIFIDRTRPPYSLISLNFISKLKKLSKFITNYKIQDGNLTPLLSLDDVSIFEFYKNYNLTDKDLPHKEVLIEENGDVKRVNLSDLPKGKNDERIVWF